MIPGITNSGFDTDGMVDELMDAERQPVTRMEEEIDTFEEERAAWQEIGRRLSNLQEAGRLLFGFENPFNDRIASSADEYSITAVADRTATEGTTRLEVRQLAEADRFISRNLPTDFEVARGRYGFRVGDSELYFNYSGGSLESFARAVNERAGDIVNARVVQNTSTTKILLVEAKRTGSENELSFLEDARALALEAGILEEVIEQVLRPPIQASTVSGPTPGTTRVIQSGRLTVEPGGEARIDLPSTSDPAPSLVLELDVKVTNLYEEAAEPEVPTGPEIPDAGDITLGDITIRNEQSIVEFPPWQPPEPPVVVDDLNLLYLESGTNRVRLPALADTTDFERLRIPISDYVNRLDALEIVNNNTHRTVEIRDIAIFDTATRGDMSPVNAISTARDAIVAIEGIEVVRPENTISDLVEGVTLTLRAPSAGPVEITVEPDREAVTDSLIQFIFYYNELIREINILTRSEQAIVDELTNLSSEEREEALDKLGRMQGNLALNSLKTRMQRIMMDPYPTEAGRELTLLAQMGISSNETGFGGGFQASRLRGYLEMNPQDVDAALRARFDAVRQLFGSDSDGDRAIDTGIAYQVDQYVRPYTQVGGIIATRTGNIDQSISSTEERIEREEARLARVESQYREDFARMEAAMGRLQENRQTFENLATQTGGQ
jgi:flagellar hook-associated protein 2